MRAGQKRQTRRAQMGARASALVGSAMGAAANASMNSTADLTAGTDCVLVVHNERSRRDQLTGALERLGFDVIAVASPFEAIWTLERQPQRIRAVLVSAHLDATDPGDLLHFIARRHPLVRRVLMPSSTGDCPANDFDPDIDYIVMDAPWDVFSLFSGLQ